MRPKVTLTREAVADVAEAASWYRERSVRAAEEFLLAINVAFIRIADQPTANVIVDAETGARRALLRKFPQRVLYLIDANQIVIFGIIHHRRDEPAWRERLDRDL